MWIVKQLFGALTFLLMAAAVVFMIGPALFDDLRHSGSRLVPAPGVRVQEASCKTFVYVVSFCHISLASPSDAEHHASLILLGPTGGEAVVPMRSPEGGPYLTTGFARSTLVNRSIAFMLAVVFVIVGFVFSVRRLVRGRAQMQA